MQIIKSLFVVLLLASCSTIKTNHALSSQKKEKNYVLLVSFDGFRYDYPEKYNLKNFKKLQQTGTYAKRMLPSFPSKTFPNHYSIITGMYPGNHGIVDNKFLHPSLGLYSIPDRKAVQNPSFYGGFPLWQWLQRQGMKTASYFWVGSEAPIKGEFPTYHYNYDSSVGYEKRIAQVEKWLCLPEQERPQFITLYFEFVDAVGHRHGPSSEEIRKAVQQADYLLGLIMKMVEESKLPITTIITSDHGMIDMKSTHDKLIVLEPIEKEIEKYAQLINNGMHCQVYLKDQRYKDVVFQQLQSYFRNQPAVKVYQKENTPKRWHYNHNDNIGDFVIVSEAPYYMVHNRKDPVNQRTYQWGTHGYDPYTTPEMSAIFYAFGKNIKEKNCIDSFENIHIYPLITHLLGVNPPEDIDGKTEVLLPIIKK